MTRFIFVALMLFGFQASAEMEIALYGTLHGFDESTAKIRLEGGNIAVVPLDTLATPIQGLIAGKAKVMASVPLSLLLKHNPALAKGIETKRESASTKK